MKYTVAGVIVLAVLAIQFIPYGRDHANPPIVAEPRWDSPKTRELFFRSCANCHSNETTWPVYSNVAPVSWLVQFDVEEGREKFNVSLWGVQARNDGKDAAEELREKEMPPWIYLLGHPEARLSNSDRAELVRGLAATFGGK